MSQPKKIIKLPDGDAFIEIGESYIRFGVGTKVFMTLDESAISAGADRMNWQMDPTRVTYQGLLSHIGSIGGLSPVGPKYQLNLQIIRSLINTFRSIRNVSSAVGIGV